MDDKNNDEKTYSTFDLGLATMLTVLKFEIVELDRSLGKKVKFIFRKDGRKGDIEKIANDYYADNLTVAAQTYFNAMKTVKNRIYSS